MNLTLRPTSEFMEHELTKEHRVLDYGMIRVVDYMGTSASVVQAARVSYGGGTKTVREDRGLIHYLLRHHHTTPFEMLELKLHVKLPLFVARQWIRHRTANVNEYSARYSVLDREFYIPEPAQIAKQSTGNKQGREEGIDDLSADEIRAILLHDANRAYDSYEELLDEDNYGLARELARMNLPTNIYTQWYWKVDLHNLLNFLRLRADSHAQYEIRVYAEIIEHIVAGWLPEVYEAWIDYVRDAATFSRQEMEIIREGMKFAEFSMPDGMSSREWREFIDKIGVQ